ncbi:MAG: hypothetical protein ACEQSQ_11765 [Candidatus Paceibacteria bacterium]
MNNQNIKELISKVEKIMEDNNCRLYDSDILKAVKTATFDYNVVDGYKNISINFNELIQFNKG